MVVVGDAVVEALNDRTGTSSASEELVALEAAGGEIGVAEDTTGAAESVSTFVTVMYFTFLEALDVDGTANEVTTDLEVIEVGARDTPTDEAEDTAADEGTADEGVAEDTPTDEGAEEDTATDEGAADEGAADEGATDEGATKDATTDDGATEDARADEGTTEDTADDEGVADDEAAEDGAAAANTGAGAGAYVKLVKLYR